MQGRTISGEKKRVGVVGQQSGSCGTRVQQVVVALVQPACRALTCWFASDVFTKEVGFHQVWWQGPNTLLVLRWDVGEQRMCSGAQGLKIRAV